MNLKPRVTKTMMRMARMILFLLAIIFEEKVELKEVCFCESAPGSATQAEVYGGWVSSKVKNELGGARRWPLDSDRKM